MLRRRKRSWRQLCSLPLLIVAPALWAAPATCTTSSPQQLVQVQGPTGDAIQDAIDRAKSGQTVLLGGRYEVQRTIRLKTGVSLCAPKMATLAWSDIEQPGLMLAGDRIERVNIQNLILDGRGISLKGQHLRVENNWIRHIDAPPQTASGRLWPQRHGLIIVDQARDLVVRGNRFDTIGDTGIMAYGLRQSTLSDNHFVRVKEAIHLWSSGTTIVKNNSGESLEAMAIEVQGDALPGLQIIGNRFKNWVPQKQAGGYAMSVVSGQDALVADNIIEARPDMAATLEVGGISPTIQNNQLTGAPLVIATAPDAWIKGNTLLQAGILKDVNRVKGGALRITGNQIIDPPRYGITTDVWLGYSQVSIEGNVIRKTLDVHAPPFTGIQLTGTGQKPMVVSQNSITLTSAPARQPLKDACFANSGHQGDMRGTAITDNICTGTGREAFMTTNAQGGHLGVVYRRNRLSQLRATITGDSQGLISEQNQLDRVTSDAAGLGR